MKVNKASNDNHQEILIDFENQAKRNNTEEF